MEHTNILLVEDSELDAELTIEYLSSIGYKKNNIHHVSSLQDFEARVKSCSYIVIISDYDLIVFSVLDVIKKLRDFNMDTPVICLTGAIGEEKAAVLMKQGISGYLLKKNLHNLKDLIDVVARDYEKNVQLKEMQQQIINNELKYRSLFNNLSVGVAVHEIIYDHNKKPVDYKMTELNKMAEKILNFENKEVNNKTATEIYDEPSSPYLEIYSTVVDTKKAYKFQTYYEKMDKYFDVVAYSTEKDTFITIFSDVSDSVKADLQLRNSQRLESIGTLASGIAHEINNPINGILNYSQIIMDSIEKNSVIYSYANNIKDESLRIAETTRNLLQFSRHETGRNEYVDVSQIINQTISLIESAIKKEGINLNVELETELKLNCQPQQVQQILMNLLLNAIHAVKTRNKHDNKPMKIFIKSERVKNGDEDMIRIVIEDNGSGIPKEYRDRIFDPFFTTKSRTEGTGLGLSISKKIAQSHKGSLYFKTQENVFTRFYLELPQERVL